MIQHSILQQQQRGASAPVHLGGALVGKKKHICAFSAHDEYRTLLPFIQNGLKGGEAAFPTVDPARANDHVNRHRAAGIDVDAYCRNGQLELKTWNEVHLRGGTFDPPVTKECVAKILSRGSGCDCSLVRTRAPPLTLSGFLHTPPFRDNGMGHALKQAC